MQKPITYSARATSETNMLVIYIDTINKLRSDNTELNAKIKATIQGVHERGMPMLDYIILKKQTKINALLDRDEFHSRKVF